MFQALDFLESFSVEEIDWILNNARQETLITAAVLLQEGGRNENIYLIVDGLFDIFVCDPTGISQRISQSGPGQIVGEISWLNGEAITATVKAAENSSVLALATSALDQKIDSDLTFATHVYKAIAKLQSERLKRASPLVARLQQTEHKAAENASGVLKSFGEQLSQFTDLLIALDKRAVEAKGEIAADLKEKIFTGFDCLNRPFTEALYFSNLPESNRAAMAREVQRQMVPWVQLSTIAERFYSKPRGYAGDYLTIQMIYDDVPAGIGRMGPVLDRCFLSAPAAKAVQNRRRLLKEQIKQQRDMQTRPVRLTSLACGPTQEVFDTFQELGSEGFEVTGIDIDREAIALLTDRIEKERVPIRVQHGNLIYLATGRDVVDLAPQDLIYSIGLIDYFNDKFVVKLINWIHKNLRPGGRVILGNFHPSNPSRAFMDHVLDWRLIHRDEKQMDELFRSSAFAKPCTRILFEEEGVNLFAECVRE